MASSEFYRKYRRFINSGLVVLFCLVLIALTVFDARNDSSANLDQAIQKAEPSPSLISAQISSQVKIPAKTRTPTPRLTATRTPTPRPTATHTPTPPAKTPKPTPTVTCSGGFSGEFLCLINQYRVANGRGLLAYDSRLNQAAFGHSMWMSNTGIFSHTEDNGSNYSDRCAAAGTTCYAENIAGGVSSAQQLFQLWKNSSVHNAIMLGPYSALGLGLASGYVTADFR